MHGINLVGAKKLRLNDIVTFDPNDFVLIDIVNDPLQSSNDGDFMTDPGVFVYDMQLSFDSRRIVDERIQAIKLEVFDSNPGLLKPFNDPKIQRSQRAKYDHQIALNEFNARKIEPIFNHELQLGVPLPSDSIPLDGVKPEQLHVNLRQRREIVLESPLQTQSKGLSMTIDAPVQDRKRTFTIESNRTSSSLARDNLRIYSIDPAKCNQLFVPFLPSIEGVKDPGKKETAPRYNPYSNSKAIEIVKEITQTPARFSLQSIRNTTLINKSLEYLNNFKVQNFQQVLRKEFNTVSSSLITGVNVNLGNQVFVDTYFLTKNFRLELNKQDIGNSKHFFIRLSLVLADSATSSSVQLESSVFQIQHAEQLKRLAIPKIPPSIESIGNSINGAIFKVTQNDPIASKVIVLKRIITTDPFDEEPFKLFEELDLSYGEKSVILQDNQPGNWLPNQTIYTAIVQHDGQDGPFDSLVFDKISNSIIKNVNEEDGSSKISIVATNLIEGVKIRIGKIASNVILLSLYREQLNALGSKRQRTVNIRNAENSETTWVAGGTEGFEFFDPNVAPNGKYRYFCVLTLRGGHRIESSEDEIIFRRTTRDELPLDVELKNANVFLNENDLFSVSMELLTQQKSSTFQYVKELLGEQAANQEFLSEIENNRDELNDVMIFYVQRIDLNTGKRVALGFHKSGTFVDDEVLANNLQVPNVKPGRKYVYSFTACLVPPSTFLSGVFNRLSTGNKIGIKDIEYLANKFDNYIIRNFGIIPSNAQLINKLNVEQLILIGNTGLSYEVSVEIPRPLNVISKIDYDYSIVGTKVFWELSNFANELIDYCNVFVTVNGNKELIGSVRNSGVNSTQYFMDDRYHNSIGEHYYSVVAIFYDGSSSTEVQSNIMKKISNINARVLKNIIASPAVIKGNLELLESRKSKFEFQKVLQLEDLMKMINDDLKNNSTEIQQIYAESEDISNLRNQTNQSIQFNILNSEILNDFNLDENSNGQDKLAERRTRFI
jgi:hypothetical protein